MKQIGFILWDGETVRTGHDNAIKVYAKEEMARRISIAMGIPYRAVFIDEGGAPVEEFKAPVEPKKPDVEWCLRQLKAAEAALNTQGLEGTIRAVGSTISVLLEMLDPS